MSKKRLLVNRLLISRSRRPEGWPDPGVGWHRTRVAATAGHAATRHAPCHADRGPGFALPGTGVDGATREQIARVQGIGYAAWLDEQFALAPTGTRWDWLAGAGFNGIDYKNSEGGADAMAWRKMLSSPDTLRQRVTFALSEIIVAAVAGFVGSGWKQFSAAADSVGDAALTHPTLRNGYWPKERRRVG